MSNASLTKSKPVRAAKAPPSSEQTAPKTSQADAKTSSFAAQFREVYTREFLQTGKAGPTLGEYQPAAVSKLGQEGINDSFGQLTIGTVQLASAIWSHVAGAREPGKGLDFHIAYTAIMESVPEAKRPELLRSMREGLEKVARTELKAASAPAAASGKDAAVSTTDFMAGLERQEAAQRERDTAAGALIAGATLAARLKMTPQGLHHALKAKRVFTLRGASGEQLYPAFYADQRQDRKVLEKVSKALGDLPGAAKWDFFMSPRTSLGKRTPLEALAKGKVEAVMLAANAFAEE